MPIYLLHGDAKSTDPQLIRERYDVLLKGIPRDGNLNFTTYDLSESGTSLIDVIDSALTVPFLGGKRVVVAKNVKSIEKAFIKSDDSETSEKTPSGNQETILKALDQLIGFPGDALLIFVESNGHLDGRTAFFKALKKAECTIEAFKAMWFDPASGDIGSAVSYIQSEATKLGIRIDTPTAEAFVTRVGSDRATMLNELEKLAMYVEDGSRPTVQDIVNSVTESYEAGIFALVDYIGHGRTDKALESLANLMDRGAVAPYILTMIARQMRLIAQVRELGDSGVPRDRIAAELHESAFVIGKILKQSRSIGKLHYSTVLEWLMETDVHLKRGTMPGKPPGKLALEILITKLSGTEVESYRSHGGN